jgi:hypothetical protein
MRDRPLALERKPDSPLISSFGYLLGLDMTAEDLLSPGQHPGIEVSLETGLAQTVRFDRRAAIGKGVGEAVPRRGNAVCALRL